MTEEIERLIQTVEGQPPSPEFNAQLRARIVAETEGAGAEGVAPDSVTAGRAVDDDIVVLLDVEPSPDDRNERATRRTLVRRQGRRLAAAAAVAAVVVGIWGLISTTDDEVPLDAVTATSVPGQDDADDDRQLLTAGNTVFHAGTYSVDTLGTPFTFSVVETTGLLLNDNAAVSITDVTSVGPDDRTLTLRRATHLPDPSDPTAAFDPSEGWPVRDLHGWVDALGAEIPATEPTDTTLGGLDAIHVALDLSELNCSTPDCPSASADEHGVIPALSPGSAYRVWVVDQGEQDPVVVIVAIDDPGEAAWFDQADAILATLEFDEVQASPVRQATAGPTELDVFGGLTILAPEETVIVEPFDRFARIIPQGIGGEVEFLTAPLDTDGVEVTSTEHLLKLLRDEAVELNELAPADIGGFDTRTFELSSGPFPNVVLKTRPADLVRPEFGWESPQVGHLWVIEHPDHGVLLVATEAFAGPAAVEPLRSWTAGVLETLEFADA